MIIRDERPEDVGGIRALHEDALRDVPYSNHSEHWIVDRLRDDGSMTVSLVADEDGAVVGHVAFSPVTIAGAAGRWFGLGPLAVTPKRQRTGIGSLLVRDGLARLRDAEAAGCVVLGGPTVYQRHGFRPTTRLTLAGAPLESFMAIAFNSEEPDGVVAYHPAFSIA